MCNSDRWLHDVCSSSFSPDDEKAHRICPKTARVFLPIIRLYSSPIISHYPPRSSLFVISKLINYDGLTPLDAHYNEDTRVISCTLLLSRAPRSSQTPDYVRL